METIVGNVAIDVPPGVAVKTSKDGETVTLDFEGSGFNGLRMQQLHESLLFEMRQGGERRTREPHQ